jgi:hypothetical protein
MKVGGQSKQSGDIFLFDTQKINSLYSDGKLANFRFSKADTRVQGPAFVFH